MRRRISFTASGPVRGQGRPKAYVKPSGHAGLYQTDADLSYREMLRVLALEAMRKAGYSAAVADAERGFTVKIEALRAMPGSFSKRKRRMAMDGRIPVTAKPDIDNVIKMVLDAMNGIVYPDDRLVQSVWALKAWDDADMLAVDVSWDDGKEDGDAV